jgi:hypothetical protein
MREILPDIIFNRKFLEFKVGSQYHIIKSMKKSIATERGEGINI